MSSHPPHSDHAASQFGFDHDAHSVPHASKAEAWRCLGFTRCILLALEHSRQLLLMLAIALGLALLAMLVLK
jgi:hypothetical protein